MKTFQIGEVEFVIDTRPGAERGISSDNSFILVKDDNLLDFYINWQGSKPKTIMEIGMFEGGSLVLMDKLFNPERIVGLDARKNPIEPLEAYVSRNPHMRTYYARYQDKIGTLRAAQENFPNGIDLVVDDASHLYEQSKATFEMLFPLVTPGGRYIIEDWSWAHWAGRQSSDTTWFDKPALSNLIFQLTLLAGRFPVIEKVEVTREMVVVTKGKGILPEEGLDLTKLLRGRTLNLI